MDLTKMPIRSTDSRSLSVTPSLPNKLAGLKYRKADKAGASDHPDRHSNQHHG
jgi:hypothetical protein